MSLSEEKKLIKEIEQLKTSKKTAAQFMTQEEVRQRTHRNVGNVTESVLSFLGTITMRIMMRKGGGRVLRLQNCGVVRRKSPAVRCVTSCHATSCVWCFCFCFCFCLCFCLCLCICLCFSFFFYFLFADAFILSLMISCCCCCCACECAFEGGEGR